MAYQATDLAAPRAPGLGGRLSAPLRAVLPVHLATRLAVIALAAVAATSLGDLGRANQATFDTPALTHPAGGASDTLLSPLARWDASWYLEIADSGYGDAGPRTAFFPLYPLLARAGAELVGGSRTALLASAELLSLAALLGALMLLWRLARIELGERAAAATVLLTAVFPGSVFFGAPYSESLFLLLSVGAVLAAREGRWAWAGLAAAGATATRSAGILLLVPLVIMLLYGPRADGAPAAGGRGWRPRYGPGREGAWLLLAPAGLFAYAAYLGLAFGDPLAFASAQADWHRELVTPFGGIWQGLRAAAEALSTLVGGAPADAPLSPLGGPARRAAMDLGLFLFLLFGVAAAIGSLRRLPLAYGAYVVVALALPLSFPAGGQPLMSLPRFLAVLFPLFMWLGLVCDERRITVPVAGLSAVLLGLFAFELGAWHFVA
jgi:mannosyltransferase PIG-V